jgi:hypothetical protein
MTTWEPTSHVFEAFSDLQRFNPCGLYGAYYYCKLSPVRLVCQTLRPIGAGLELQGGLGLKLSYRWDLDTLSRVLQGGLYTKHEKRVGTCPYRWLPISERKIIMADCY